MSHKIPPSTPRNPLVAPSLFRQAGAHHRSRKALRQRERAALRRELHHTKGHTEGHRPLEHPSP